MTETKKTAGRPRMEDVGPRLKQSVLHLVRAKGYGAVSINEIIKEAGVSRQSLYRRWPTKAALVLEALNEAAPEDAHPLQTGQTVQQALLAFLKEVFSHLNADGQTLRNLIASAQEDPQFRECFVRDFVQPREDIVVRLLETGIERGELATTTDVDLTASIFHGVFWYRLLNDKPLDDDVATSLVAQIFK